MKTVAILSDLCLSSPRIPGLAKYVGRCGWRPVVIGPPLPKGHALAFGPNRDFLASGVPFVTLGAPGTARRPGEGTRLRALVDAHPLLFPTARFLYTRYRELASYPDDHAAWVREHEAAAAAAVREAGADVLLSSSSPVSMLILADRLSRALGVPWVADFRDPWTQNHNYPYSPLRRAIERRLERRTLASASAIVSASQPFCDMLAALHPGRSITSITNGFDPDLAPARPADPTGPVFTLLYTGSIYPKRQDARPILDAVSLLLAGGVLPRERLRLDFYGPRHAWLDAEIARRGLANVVAQRGMTPREEALRRQQSAHVLVLFNWEAPRDLGVIPLKTFEYLAAGRPILATGGRVADTVGAILAGTGAGTVCRTAADTAAFLSEMARRFLDTGRVPFAGNAERIAEYAYPRMAEKFARVFDAVLDRAR